MIILFLLSIASVIALGDYLVPNKGGTSTADRDIITISNCYNISLRVKQTSGVKVIPSFKDCTDNGDGYWSCDCHASVDDYTLVMRTDTATDLDEDREYSVTMNYRVYDLSKERNIFTIRDDGSSMDVFGEHLEELGKDIVVVEKPIYINQTIYKDRVVESPPVYLDRIVNVPTEDLTRINLLQENITRLEGELRKGVSSDWIIIGIISIILNLVIGYMYWRK